MSAHSAGPWHVSGEVTVYSACNTDGGMVATGIYSEAANARLIAAAPELLDMLRDGLGWDGVEPRWRREALALIARIEGTP